MPPTLVPTRRQFLAAATAGVITAARFPVFAAPADEAISFFVVGDTHYLANKEDPSKLDDLSARTTTNLIDTLNKLPGTAIPGGGAVGQPLGLIHAGDLIDSGDKNGGPHEEMQKTEWSHFHQDFGLTGNDARLKVPVYEVHGNHDGPGGKGLVLDKIKERNRTRVGAKNVSANGLHYSWDWGPAHLACLGIVVGEDKSVKRQRRYAPLDSLAFLVDDLKANVGSSGRPVVITHHVDVARYTGPCNAEAPFKNEEWDRCDVHAYYEALKPYNVAGIFYGHTHTQHSFRWDGLTPKATEGVNVFNVAKASHFKSDKQALYYVTLANGAFTVREYVTADRWATGAWTPTAWTSAVKA